MALGTVVLTKQVRIYSYVRELDVAVEAHALASVLLGRPSLDRPCIDCSATFGVWCATGILDESVLLSAMTCQPPRSTACFTAASSKQVRVIAESREASLLQANHEN
jgi:hypothetical protein